MKYNPSQVVMKWGPLSCGPDDCLALLPHTDTAIAQPSGWTERVPLVVPLTAAGVAHCIAAGVWPPALGSKFAYGYLTGRIVEADAFVLRDESGMLFLTIEASGMSAINQALAGVDTLAIQASAEAVA